MRILSWNLFHGRAVPERRESLLGEFCAAIAGWEWEVALLQEVPPWWPGLLGAAAGAAHRSVRTSRNGLPRLRRVIADRRPDLAKSSGGGANAILVRPAAGHIEAHAARRLRVWPERRFVHAVRLTSGLWVANVHAQVRPHADTRADLALAGATVLRWAADAPALLGGDCNVPDPRVAGFTDLGGHRVDRFLAHGPVVVTQPAATLERPGGLSDHAPVRIAVAGPGDRELS